MGVCPFHTTTLRDYTTGLTDDSVKLSVSVELSWMMIAMATDDVLVVSSSLAVIQKPRGREKNRSVQLERTVAKKTSSPICKLDKWIVFWTKILTTWLAHKNACIKLQVYKNTYAFVRKRPKVRVSCHTRGTSLNDAAVSNDPSKFVRSAAQIKKTTRFYYSHVPVCLCMMYTWTNVPDSFSRTFVDTFSNVNVNKLGWVRAHVSKASLTKSYASTFTGSNNVKIKENNLCEIGNFHNVYFDKHFFGLNTKFFWATKINRQNMGIFCSLSIHRLKTKLLDKTFDLSGHRLFFHKIQSERRWFFHSRHLKCVMYTN